MKLLRSAMFKDICRILFFFAVYTVLFFLVVGNIRYTFPFLLGGVLFGLACPLQRFLRKRFSISSKNAEKTALLFVFGSGFLVLSVLFGWILLEIRHLLKGQFGFIFSDLDPRVQDWLYRRVEEFPDLKATLAEHMDAFLPYVRKILGWLVSVPALFLIPALSFMTASLLLRDRCRLRRGLMAVFGHGTVLKIRRTWKRHSKTSVGFLTSYFLIYLITFSEALLILFVLQMPYPVITALLVTVFDLIPILGPGSVLLPLALYRLLCNNLAQTLGLIFGWLLITVIRQITEPKLLADVTRIPRILMIAAVYFALLCGNFWLIPYTMLTAWLLHLLVEAGILSNPFVPLKNNTDINPSAEDS